MKLFGTKNINTLLLFFTNPFNILVLIIILQVAHSCGYQPTEKDKYPNLSLFPNISSKKFQVTKFLHEEYSIEGIYNNLLYMTYTADNNEYGYGGKNMFSAYSTSYKEIVSFPISYEYKYFDEKGNLYCHINDTIIKYSYPKFYPKRIELFPISSETIYNEMDDSIQRMKTKNPNFDDYDFVKKELTNRVLHFKSNNSKIRYFQLHEEVILYIKNKIYWMPDNYLDKINMTKIDDLWRKKSTLKNQQQSGKLSVFDNAALKNEGSGNHFTMSFYQSGFEYYNLVMLNDTIQFKYPSKSLDGKSLRVVQSFDKDNTILIMSENKNLFMVKHK